MSLPKLREIHAAPFADRVVHHVLVDRTRPMDYEVVQIESVTGYGTGPAAEQAFMPFYTSKDIGALHQDKAFYQLRREQRVVSQRQRRDGPRSSYIGSEAFVSIVDAAEKLFFEKGVANSVLFHGGTLLVGSAQGKAPPLS